MQKIRFLGTPELWRQFRFFKSGLTEVDSFESFAKMTFHLKHIHWQSQYETLFFQRKQLVDFIGKVENIDEDLKLVCQERECRCGLQPASGAIRGALRDAVNAGAMRPTHLRGFKAP